MTYETAMQAIAVSRHHGKTTSCKRTPQNIVVLLDAASEVWTSGGLEHFECTERGDEWTVTIEVQQ